MGGDARAGETHEELVEDLQDYRGRQVAIGLYPPWLYDTDDVIEAISPDNDGTVERGIY